MSDPASEPAYGEQNEALEPGVDRVLVIDDDRELCELVREYLVQECFYVDLIHEGRHGLEQALSGKYDVVILDVMLPGMNGLQVLQAIRRASRVGEHQHADTRCPTDSLQYLQAIHSRQH